MRRYTQRRDAHSGQPHTSAEDIRKAALEALLPEELERHCQLRRSRLDTYQKPREVVLCAQARGYVAPKLGQVAKAREDRDDLMLEDLDNGNDDPTFKGKGKNTGKWKRAGKYGANSPGQANAQKIPGSVLEKRENKVINRRIAGARPETIEFSWKGKRCERQVRQKVERQVQRCWSTCLGISKLEVPVASSVAPSATAGRKRKQAQRLVRLTRLNAQRWLCVQRGRESSLDSPSMWTLELEEHVWPMNADHACEKVSGPAGRHDKTATSEMKDRDVSDLASSLCTADLPAFAVSRGIKTFSRCVRFRQRCRLSFTRPTSRHLSLQDARSRRSSLFVVSTTRIHFPCSLVAEACQGLSCPPRLDWHVLDS